MKKGVKTFIKYAVIVIICILCLPLGLFLGGKVADIFYLLCLVPFVAFIVLIAIAFSENAAWS